MVGCCSVLHLHLNFIGTSKYVIKEMEVEIGGNVVVTKNCVLYLSFYPDKIPETCRWLREKVIVALFSSIPIPVAGYFQKY